MEHHVYGRARRALFLPLAIVIVASACDQSPRRFSPNTDGFNFQNYTNMDGVTNLTAAELHRFFGDAACESGTTGASCRPTPQAQQWMEQTNQIMNGGHCEGMAILSLRMFLGQQRASDFGAMTTNQLAFTNPALQREIAYWFATQTLEPITRARIQGTPTEIVDRLRQSFSMSERYTIAFFKPDWTGGHAVTPYDVQDMGPGRTDILVYDNNFPNQERRIEVDTNANTWSYVAASDPSQPEARYEGNASTRTLAVVPISARMQQVQCPFCGNYSPGASGERTVRTAGNASLLIINEAGQRLGHQGTSMLEEIPGARFSAQASNLFRDRQEPTYHLPGQGVYDIEIAHGGGDAVAPTTVSVEGPGYYLGVENITLDVGQVDVMNIDASVAALYYETAGLETPDIVLAVQTPDADWLLILRTRGDSGGQAIDAVLDMEYGVLDFFVDGADAESELDLAIARIDGATEIDFDYSGLVVPNGAVLSLFFGEFDANGDSMPLDIDYDADGVADDGADLIDER